MGTRNGMRVVLSLIAFVALMQIAILMQFPDGANQYMPNIAPHMGGKIPQFRTPTLVNYTQDQGFDPIPTPYILNAETMSKYRSYYGIEDKPPVYFITPTYRRNTQLVDLVTLSQTLQHDKAVFWIIIEDAEQGSKRVRDVLERSGMMFAHGSVKSLDPKKHPNAPRGVLQRNLGLDIVETIGIPGVVYFGDDDNKYDVRLMEGIRYTKGVGIFGVGFRSQAMYARCKVDPQTGKVTGTTSKWYKPGNNVAMDMAGFCANSDLMKETKARFRNNAPPGRIENDFLKQLGKDVTEMEPLLDNCSRIYAWHVQSKISGFSTPKNISEWDPAFESIQPGV